ncbi:MAG: 3-hydroxyacyl-CoA dehydrogenase family protein, partial [Stellaceae bacterium]
AEGGTAIDAIAAPERFRVILLELGTECLAVHAPDAPNVLGFARFRLGDDPASPLVELVRQDATAREAIEAARTFIGASGLEVALCRDFPGRIIDRLIRPYFNSVLQRLDEGLATAADLDLTVRLGLGYPVGPVTLLGRSGLAQHFDISQALFEAYGERALVPARRAQVAHERRRRGKD